MVLWINIGNVKRLEHYSQIIMIQGTTIYILYQILYYIATISQTIDLEDNEDVTFDVA